MKKLTALLLALVMVLSLCACGGSGNQPAAAPTDSSAPPAPAEAEVVNSEETIELLSSEGFTCAPGETAAPAGKVQKTLTIGTAQDINNLNPQMQNDSANNLVLYNTHQSLGFACNDGGETGVYYGPMIAKSWEWEDDNTFVFHLRDDVCFSTGEPLTAADCVFTYEMAMKPESYVSGSISIITGVEARDDYTFVIKTSKYSNELIDTLVYAPMSILSKAAFESGMEEPWLVGTGQYVFDEWVEGQYVRLVRNENYWGDDPGVADEIIFKPILEATSRVIALQNGEIDVCVDPPATELPFLEEDPNVTVYQQAGTRVFYLGFNCQKAPFDNKLVRQAVSSAINKEMVLQAALGGKGQIQDTVVNRGVFSFYNEEDLGAYTYDLEKAQALLAEAGYQPGELTVDLYAANDDPYKTIAPVIQGCLAQIGVNVNIVSLDQATLKTECQAGNQQMFLWRWNVVARLDEIYTELFTTDYPSNYHHFSSEYMDKMAVEILTQKDADLRYDESVEVQKYLAEECPQVPFYTADLVIAFKNGLRGTYLFGGGNHRWTHAYVLLSE